MFMRSQGSSSESATHELMTVADPAIWGRSRLPERATARGGPDTLVPGAFANLASAVRSSHPRISARATYARRSLSQLTEAHRRAASVEALGTDR